MRIQSLSFQAGRGWSEPIDRTLDSPSTLVLAFGAPEFGADPAPWRELRQRLPRALVFGCSTAGEIQGTKVTDHSVSVAVLRLDHSTLRGAALAVDSSDESRAVGERLGRALAGPDLRGVILFADERSVNGSELVEGINQHVGGSAVIAGGLAGHRRSSRQTWVVHDGAPRSGIVAGVGFFGQRLRIGQGAKGGWDSFGPERVVTRAAGNVLYELDGKPALRLYKDYLGDRAAGLPGTALRFPLGVRAPDASTRQMVRTILAIDESAQSLTFAGDIPEGALAQLMRANSNRLVQGASDAAQRSRGADPDAGPLLSIAISCVGRRLVLGERVEEETEAALAELPPETQQVGFYSHGEISPRDDGGCDLHNQTMTLTTLAEI